MWAFKSLFKAVKSHFQARAAQCPNPGKMPILAPFSVFIFSRKFPRFHAALKPIFRTLKPFPAFSSLFKLRARLFLFYMNTYTDRKSGQKTAKKAKKHIAGKNWKEYDRYRRKNRKEALTFQQKHVEFRYTKESDWSWLHESA